MSRFLCTTALEESWPEEGPVLFLGEWCRRHIRKEAWAKLDATVMPYHWDDRAKYQADYRSLQLLHERLLSELAAQLNRIHGVTHDTRYWRLLVGPWLGFFVQMVYDRWVCIRQSVVEYGVSDTIVLYGSEAAFVPRDMVDFQRHFISDEWNHYIYGYILQHHFPQVRCARVERRVGIVASETGRARSWRRSLRQSLAALVQGSAGLLSRGSDVFLWSSYLPARDEIKLQLRMGQMPQRWLPVTPRFTVEVDPGQRQWLPEGADTSPFETCVRAMIPAQIPAIYLEGYGGLLERVRQLPWPRTPSLIFTSNAVWTDDVFKAWAAEKVADGTPLIVGQHGGHLGVGLWSFAEDHEVAISDRYLSWGWSDPHRPSITPACALTARRPLGVRHASRERALLVTGSYPRFSYWMYSTIVARQWVDYFEDQCSFVAHLPPRIRDALTVRLYPDDYGWDQVARWRERAPEVHLDQGESSMEQLIRGCRVYISTYNATTYLESLMMNVPTVVFWDPRHWELRDSAVEFFEDLKRIRVFHETPESAARHLTAIWDDVESWWSSPAVREVIERFKHRYCRVAQDPAAVLEKVFRDISSAPRLGAVQ